MRSAVTVCSALLMAGLSGCGDGSMSSPNPPTLSVSPPPGPISAESEAAAKLLDNGKLSEALVSATKGIEKSPHNAVAYETRAAIQHKLGLLDAAVADFSRAVELDPQNARLRNNRGYLWLSRQEFDKALADFDAAIALSPEYANAHNNRGLLQIAQGRHRQAVLDLNRALKADPNYVDAYNNRGFALMQLGVWDRALADFNLALRLDPQGVNALANRGFVKQNLGDAAGAIIDFTEAMMLDPDNPKYYLHRREAYLLEGSLDKAQQDAAQVQLLQQVQSLTAAIARSPRDPQACLVRGRYFLHQDNVSRARADFSKAIEIAPQFVPALLERAALLYDMRDFQAAIADCEVVLTVEPHQQAHSIRGDCRLELQDLDGTLADFEAAKRIDPKVADAYFRKGQTLVKKGDAEAAQTYLSQAKALDPEVESRLR